LAVERLIRISNFWALAARYLIGKSLENCWYWSSLARPVTPEVAGFEPRRRAKDLKAAISNDSTGRGFFICTTRSSRDAFRLSGSGWNDPRSALRDGRGPFARGLLHPQQEEKLRDGPAKQYGKGVNDKCRNGGAAFRLSLDKSQEFRR
jgi:hypothetical protein